MKFMNKLQCLMGGNAAVQFQHSSLVTQSSSSLVLLENTTSNNDASSSSVARDHKKKKLKKKKQKKIKDGKVIKVFKPDGEINVYKKAIKVSEVMTEELMVCRSDSFYIGQKIPPLEQHDRLQPGHTYFLLPSHLFHSVLSFVTIASFTSPSSKQHQDDHVAADDSKMKAAFLKKAAASSCSPFDIQKTPSGTLRIRVSELFISQLMMDQASSSSKGDHLVNLDTSTTLAADLLCTTPQLHKEYKQLVVGSRRGWKPKLEMIKETPPSKGAINKRKVKMLLSASINRMKTKLKSKNNKKVVGLAQISSSSTPKKKKRTMKKKKIKKSPVSPSSASLKANKFYNSGYHIAEKKPADVVT